MLFFETYPVFLVNPESFYRHSLFVINACVDDVNVEPEHERQHKQYALDVLQETVKKITPELSYCSVN